MIFYIAECAIYANSIISKMATMKNCTLKRKSSRKLYIYTLSEKHIFKLVFLRDTNINIMLDFTLYFTMSKTSIGT